MLKTYLIIERFAPGNISKVYQRVEQEGRNIPEGLEYINSWVSPDGLICWQIMRSPSEKAFQPWFDHWADLVQFELHEVVNSQDAQSLFSSP